MPRPPLAFILALFICFSGFSSSQKVSKEDRVRNEFTENDEGLHLLYSPPNSWIDIVAVHGLDGHWKRSWTADNGCFWLRDLLPSIIPGARIYSFGHNSKTRGSTVPLAYDIPDHGKELVSALSIERQLENTTKAPIFFIGHSLGGLIIKSALLHADTAQVGHLERQKAVKLSTYGLLFLATPHQGGQGVSIAKIITNILSTVTYTNKKLLDRIEPNSEWLQDLQSRYNSISQDFATTYFYETQEMKTPIGSLLVVPKFSAVVFGAVNSESVAMAADHSTIAKFANSQNSDFRKISRILQLFASQAKEAVAWNWKRWEVFRDYSTPPYPESHSQDRFHKGSEFSASEFKVGIAFHLIRNPQFSGRRGILQRLDYSLRKPSGGINPNIVVLYGSGGVGKTQVALEYAYRSRSKYSSIFWIDGSRNDTAIFSVISSLQHIREYYEAHGMTSTPRYRVIREALDEERRANKSQGSRRLFLSWLSYADNCSWLLVIDNVDDFEGFNLREWLPSTFCGAVIITSRRPELAINWDSIKINQMNSQEALSLLEKSSKIQIDQVPRKERDSAIELVQELGFFPLAISQAGANIAKSGHGTPIYHYLSLFQKYPKESLMQKTAERPWDIKQDTVLTTWEISFIAIEKRNPLAIQIFSICSFLSPNSIREELFVHQNTIQAQEWQVYEAFTILSSYSFFKQAIHGSSRTFSIHPLIHFWTRIRMDSEQQRQTARRTVSILRDLSLKHIPTSSHAIFLSSLFKKWSPCDNALSNIIPITPVPQEKRIWPVDLRFDTTTLIINTLRLLGREAYDHAAFATHKLLTNGKFESEDWETVDLIPTPDGPEAIKNLEWVLCHATQRFSIKGPRVLGIVSEYASVLLENSQGDGSAARAWYLWLLTTLAEQLGTDNPMAVRAYIGFGTATVDCREALWFLREAWHILKDRYWLHLDKRGVNLAMERIGRKGRGCFADAGVTEEELHWVTALIDVVGPPLTSMAFRVKPHPLMRGASADAAVGYLESHSLAEYDIPPYLLFHLLRVGKICEAIYFFPQQWTKTREEILEPFYKMLSTLPREQAKSVGQGIVLGIDCAVRPPRDASEQLAFESSYLYLAGLHQIAPREEILQKGLRCLTTPEIKNPSWYQACDCLPPSCLSRHLAQHIADIRLEIS